MRISYHTPVQHFSLKLDAFLSGWKCNLSGSQHLFIQFEYGAKTFLFFYTTWLLDISWELGKHCGVWFLAFWGYKETSQLGEMLVVSFFFIIWFAGILSVLFHGIAAHLVNPGYLGVVHPPDDINLFPFVRKRPICQLPQSLV